MKPLEEVFKTSGIPTHTFVRPIEYPALVVALRPPRRHRNARSPVIVRAAGGLQWPHPFGDGMALSWKGDIRVEAGCRRMTPKSGAGASAPAPLS